MAASTTQEESLTSINDEAIAAVCAGNLHQSLTLPATDNHGKLRVTFATTSNFDDESLPVILFISPMFAGRMPILSCDHLARTSGVRVISIDRPGFGGSTAVPVESRINVWLETVPALLQHLNIENVDAIVAHSAGTLYTLNTMYHLRNKLTPKRPYVALMAPWVDSKHSDATLMTVASMFPKGMVGSFHSLNKFIATRINPAISWSGGMFSSVADLFQGSPNTSIASIDDSAEEDDETDNLKDKYGTSDNETAAAIEKFSGKCFFAEDVSSASEDAKLCLKKCGSGAWGACEDYADFVQKFVAMERARTSVSGGEDTLQMDVYFAESDIMIGKGGQKYFEECWAQPGVEGVVKFTSIELKKTNHETIITSLKKGAMRLIFEEVARRAEV